MALTSGPTAPFYSVRYALRLLETIAGRADGIRAEELLGLSGIPAKELSHLLLMLRREGYVAQLSDGTYTAGAALELLSSGADRETAREQKLQQALDQLRDSIGAAIYLAEYAEGELTVACWSDTPSVPKVNEWVDFRSAAHATAIGKCLLSQLDDDGRQEHFTRHKAARLTSRTITDRRALLSSLDRQPARTPVLDLQEYAVGTLCAAVPLTAGSTVGCLALSLPVGQAGRLRQAAEKLSRQAAPALLSLAF